MKSALHIAAGAALMLALAPLSFAQSQNTPASPPQTPAVTPAPATPATPPAAPTPATPATPAAPTTSGEEAASSPQARMSPLQQEAKAECYTRKDVGQPCSCLDAPTDFGTSAAAENGERNLCMVPPQG